MKSEASGVMGSWSMYKFYSALTIPALLPSNSEIQELEYMALAGAFNIEYLTKSKLTTPLALSGGGVHSCE